MSYSDILSKLIKESNLSHKEISEKCKYFGKPIDPSYISKLVNGKIAAPSDELTKVISKVLGIDEQKLILEAYLDKAPKELLDFINDIRFTMITSASMIYESSIPTEMFDVMRQTLDTLPLSDFILGINSNEQFSKLSLDNNTLTTQFDSGEDKFNININTPTGIPVKDNSMYPLIPEGSLITLEIRENYKDGDILCFNKIDGKEIFIRKCFFKDMLLLLVPLNSGYDSLALTHSEVNILGKVKKVIYEI